MTNAGPNAEIADASSWRVGLRLGCAPASRREYGLAVRPMDGRSDSPATL